jgi:hypothetical protein
MRGSSSAGLGPMWTPGPRRARAARPRSQSEYTRRRHPH